VRGGDKFVARVRDIKVLGAVLRAARNFTHITIVLLLDQLDQPIRRAYSCGMTRTVNLYEAKTHLSALVDAAERGEEIVIAKNGVAKARLGPAARPARQRKPSGLLRIHNIAEDFDAPDAEIVRLFEGEA